MDAGERILRLVPGLLGLALVVLGLGGLNPVLAGVDDGSVVALFELELAERLVAGWELPLGQGIGLLAALAAAALALPSGPRQRRRFALPAAALGAVLVGVTAYVHVAGAAVVDAAAGGALAPDEVVHALAGFGPLYAGGAVLLLAAFAALRAAARWRGDERFLRVAVLWNGSIVRERVFTEPRDVTIGEGEDCDFVLPTAAAGLPERLKLFRKDRWGRYELALVPGIRGALSLRALARWSTHVPGEALLARHGLGGGVHVPVDPEDWGTVELGELSLFFQFISPEEPLPRRALAALPWDLVGTTTVSAVLQVAFLLAALFLWQERVVRAHNRDFSKPLQVSVTFAADEPPEELPDRAAAPEPAAAQAPGAEGTFGDPEVDPAVESRVPRREGAPARRVEPDKIGLNDLLRPHRLGGRSSVGRILSGDARDFGAHLALAMNGTGADLVVGHGSRGFSFRGTDSGGGGTGPVGIVHGLGPVGGDDLGPGRRLRAGRGDKKERRVGTFEVRPGTTHGFCRPGDVTKAVRLRAGAIRACYEQRLQTEPALAGKLTVRWTIQLDGSARDALVASSTLASPAVETCVLRAVRRMRFTAPEGGLCVVNWPFVFSPS